jgi:hypothetical protein
VETGCLLYKGRREDDWSRSYSGAPLRTPCAMIKANGGWAWWYKPVIPALPKLRWEDLELEVSLGYRVRPCLKKQKQNKKKLILTSATQFR